MAGKDVEVSIGADASGVVSEGKSAGDKAGKALDEGLTDGAKSGASAAESAISELGSKASSILGAIAAGASIGALSSLAEEAAETSRSMGRLETSAQQNGIAADAMKEQYLNLTGVCGDADRANEALSDSMRLCAGDQQQLESFTKSLTGAYGTYGDAMPIEALAEAANETAKTATVTGSFADALNWASAAQTDAAVATSGNTAAIDAYNAAREGGATAEDAFNEALAACNSEQERTQLITSTMNGLFGEAADQYNENTKNAQEYAKSQEELKLKIAEVGTALQPVFTLAANVASKLLDALVPALQTVGEWLNNIANDALPVINDAFSQFSEAVSPIVEWLIDAFGEIYGYITETLVPAIQNAFEIIEPAFEDLWGVLQPIFEQIGQFLADHAQTIGEDLPAIIESLAELIATAVEVIAAAIQLISDVFGLVWSIVGPILEALFSWFGDNLPGAIDSLREHWERIKDVIEWMSAVLENVRGFVEDVKKFFTEDVPGAIRGMLEWFQSLPNRIWSALSTALQSVGNFARDFGQKGWDAARNFFNNIWEGLRSLPSQVGTIGHNVAIGIWNGIAGMGKWLYNQVASFAGNILRSAKNALGIHSPSTKFRDIIGKNIARGIKVGYEIEDPMDGIIDSLNAGMRAIDVQGATATAVSRQDVRQTINFNVPTATPDVVAREMREYSHYGLAGGNTL